MFPHEHFLVVLLPVVGYVLVRDRHPPSVGVVGAAFVGSQFPDLVDKLLHLQFGLLPSGRVFMHSLPVAVPFVSVVVLYGWKTERLRLGAVFAFGHLTHLVADSYGSLSGPTPTVSPDLLWPFVEPEPRPVVPFWAGQGGVNITLWTVFSAGVLSILVVLVIADLKRQVPR